MAMMTSQALRNITLLALCVSVSILAGCSVTVPGVVGLTQTAAQTLITDAGLTVGAVTEEHSETVPSGLVISQAPAFGASAAQGTAVDLVISLGSGTVTVMLPGNVPLEMVWIAAGSFLMGSPDTEQYREVYESPQHTAAINGFWMGKYELTKRQWAAVMPSMPWAGQSDILASPESPAVYVSWNDARDFITALNDLTGKVFRLPSEAEWEYACRAGTTTSCYWGDAGGAQTNDNAWLVFNTAIMAQSYAHMAGQKLANGFGLHDMIGNAWEWCEDDWHDFYSGAPANGSAWIDSPRDAKRSARGGDWLEGYARSRSAQRMHFDPLLATPGVGFRLAGF